jgi:hypothetical protein
VEQKGKLNMRHYQDIYVVDTFEEAEQFRYTETNRSVEVGTAVGYDTYKMDEHDHKMISIDLICFDGIHYVGDDNL